MYRISWIWLLYAFQSSEYSFDNKQLNLKETSLGVKEQSRVHRGLTSTAPIRAIIWCEHGWLVVRHIFVPAAWRNRASIARVLLSQWYRDQSNGGQQRMGRWTAQINVSPGSGRINTQIIRNYKNQNPSATPIQLQRSGRCSTLKYEFRST